MAEIIPDTQSVPVALLAAAIHLGEQQYKNDLDAPSYESSLHRTLIAYRALGIAVGIHANQKASDIKIDTIMEDVKKQLAAK